MSKEIMRRVPVGEFGRIQLLFNRRVTFEVRNSESEAAVSMDDMVFETYMKRRLKRISCGGPQDEPAIVISWWYCTLLGRKSYAGMVEACERSRDIRRGAFG